MFKPALQLHWRILTGVLLLVFLSLSFPNQSEAGSITGKSLGGVHPNTIAILNYVASKVSHSLNVISAYRSPIYNASIGGAKNSMHTRGLAIDLSTTHLNQTERVRLVQLILSHPNTGGFGYYTSKKSIHFDSRGGRAYWGGSGKKKYSSSGFDQAARARQIDPLIVGLVYRWAGGRSVAVPGDGDQPLQPTNPTPSPTPSPSPSPTPTFPSPAPTPTFPSPSPTPTFPGFPGFPGFPSPGGGSVPGPSAPYPLPGLPPSTYNPGGTPTTPGGAPPAASNQCDPNTDSKRKIPTMTANEWDRAVRALYAESGSCRLGERDTNCIKVAETFRNRLIVGMEKGRSCWDTWDEILTFTNASRCGYFQANPGIKNATRLQAGSQTYRNVEKALFQAVYGGTNLSLGNLHNFTTGHSNRSADPSTIVPAGNNYTYAKRNEGRANIGNYHFPNCQPEQFPVTPSTPPTTPTQPTPQPTPTPQPVTPTQPAQPGVTGAGQNTVRSAVPSTPTRTVSGARGGSGVAHSPAGRVRSLNEQQKSLQQQHDLLSKQQSTASAEQLEEIQTQLREIEAKQAALFKEQLEALKVAQATLQGALSGIRPVTVVAAPTDDTDGIVLASLIDKLRHAGQDVLVVPDTADYGGRLDQVVTELEELPDTIKINCVGWAKGALGCLALGKKLTLQHVALIDPSDGDNERSVPGVSTSDFAANKININNTGSTHLYVPESGSGLEIYEGANVNTIDVDSVVTIANAHGSLSLGLDPSLQNQIVIQITGGGTQVSTDVGTQQTIGLDEGVVIEREFGWSGFINALTRLTRSNEIVTPIVLISWLGNGFGSFLGSAAETGPDGDRIDPLNPGFYLMLLQSNLPDDASGAESELLSDLSVVALKADRTGDKEYRFRGALSRDILDPESGDYNDFGEVAGYFNNDVVHELVIDYRCDGTVDNGIIFSTPYFSILPRNDGADALLSEYLTVPEDGLHCFAFVADIDDVISESNEENNTSIWREFIAGFDASIVDEDGELPELNFEVSVHTADYGTVTQDWTSENISIADGHQLAFRWNAPEYKKCVPLLSSLTAGSVDNTSPVQRNTLSENTELHERTGYYELRCTTEDTTRVETIHVTVE